MDAALLARIQFALTVGFHFIFPPLTIGVLGLAMLAFHAANSASSEKTLGVMLVLALVGMPIVLAYTIWAYRAFKGKVNVTDVPHN